MDRSIIILVVSAILAAMTRAFNEDLPVFKNVTKGKRALIVGGLALVSAVIDNLSTPGSTIGSAIATAFSVAGPSYLLLIIEVFGGGGPGTGSSVHLSTPPAGKSPGPYGAKMVAVGLTLALAVSGCAGSLEASKKTAPKATLKAGVTLSDYCLGLDNGARTWGAIGKGAVALSGATGISTLPVPDTDKNLRLALVTTSTVIAAVGVVALFVQDSETSDWARDCAGVAPAGAK